jgi:hypothetical protein
MQRYIRNAGEADQGIEVPLFDAAGVKVEGKVDTDVSAIQYWRPGMAAAAPVSPVALAGLDAAHADGGFLEIGGGLYRLDLPDAAFAVGSSRLVGWIEVGGAVTTWFEVVLRETSVVAAGSVQTTAAQGATSVEVGAGHAIGEGDILRLFDRDTHAPRGAAVVDSYAGTAVTLKSGLRQEVDDTMDWAAHFGPAGESVADLDLSNLDAAVSSRAPADLVLNLDNLDAPVSSRAAASDLSNLDVPVSSRAPADLLLSLDNLDVPVSSRSSFNPAVDHVLADLRKVNNVSDVDGETFIAALRILMAVVAGDKNGGLLAPVFKALDGSKTRVAGTQDEASNRTITTLDGS